jgi:hypothetical protein
MLIRSVLFCAVVLPVQTDVIYLVRNISALSACRILIIQSSPIISLEVSLNPKSNV